ncbi:MAG: FimV/HubP family polar landmark protein [Porticoccaceae bacterium]|nr:FimV/HubP family polar landmark protein [Porticoccaceae bacterium]
MRRIIAFLISWRGVIGFFKQMTCAIILSLCWSIAAADSSAISPSLADKPSIPTHTVVIGDTLWNVAIRLRPDNMPMAQAMDILYESNPDAFLEGDSTKLIEGSVVSFPSLTVVEKIPEIIVSKQNSTLIIPTLESLQIEESVENAVEVTAEAKDSPVDAIIDGVEKVEKATEEDESLLALTDSENIAKTENQTQLPAEIIKPDPPNLDSQLQDLKESVEIDLSDNNGTTKEFIQPAQTLSQPTEYIDITKSQPNTSLVEQLKTLIQKIDTKSFYQLLSKVKQLPIDFWIFLGAFIFAIVINRFRKLNNAHKSEDHLIETEKPIEAVLDGPFADNSGDDVFADTAEDDEVDKVQQKDIKPQPKEDIQLPGVEALEAQLREDEDGEQVQVGHALEVDFEDDTLEIDPLQIKLDMASLCIEMGDIESAQAILEEIIGEADKQGKAKAREILDSIET